MVWKMPDPQFWKNGNAFSRGSNTGKCPFRQRNFPEKSMTRKMHVSVTVHTSNYNHAVLRELQLICVSSRSHKATLSGWAILLVPAQPSPLEPTLRVSQPLSCARMTYGPPSPLRCHHLCPNPLQWGQLCAACPMGTHLSLESVLYTHENHDLSRAQKQQQNTVHPWHPKVLITLAASAPPNQSGTRGCITLGVWALDSHHPCPPPPLPLAVAHA